MQNVRQYSKPYHVVLILLHLPPLRDKYPAVALPLLLKTRYFLTCYRHSAFILLRYPPLYIPYSKFIIYNIFIPQWNRHPCSRGNGWAHTKVIKRLDYCKFRLSTPRRYRFVLAWFKPRSKTLPGYITVFAQFWSWNITNECIPGNAPLRLLGACVPWFLFYLLSDNTLVSSLRRLL